jgi:hypothetical protein
MLNTILFANLFLAHLVGDFLLQSNALCESKERKHHKSAFMYVHALIIALLSWMAIGNYQLWGYAAIIGVTHLMIDIAKSYVKTQTLVWFVGDQILHIFVLLIVSYFIGNGWEQFAWIPQNYALILPAFLSAVIICTKPANIFIKMILTRYEIDLPKAKDKELKNAGALIGNLERLLSLVLIIAGQFGAVGFIITAKSILRFRDYERAKTEYVLAGTLLSFGIAIICGCIIKWLI